MEDNTYSDGQSKNEAALSNLICIKEISTISRARSMRLQPGDVFLAMRVSHLEAVLTTFWNYWKNATKNRALF